MSGNEVEHDLNEVITSYPLLTPFHEGGKQGLFGEIELKDDQGGIIEVYKVKLIFTELFPYRFPHVWEEGNLIPRIADRHVYPKTGNLCLAIEPEEIIICQYGISTIFFLDRVLLPRLAEEYEVNLGGVYQREYSHDHDGFWEYFQKHFKSEDANLVMGLLGAIVSRNLPKGYEKCICGSGEKFKKCHRKSASVLFPIGQKKLKLYLSILKDKVYSKSTI